MFATWLFASSLSYRYLRDDAVQKALNGLLDVAWPKTSAHYSDKMIWLSRKVLYKLALNAKFSSCNALLAYLLQLSGLVIRNSCLRNMKLAIRKSCWTARHTLPGSPFWREAYRHVGEDYISLQQEDPVSSFSSIFIRIWPFAFTDFPINIHFSKIWCQEYTNVYLKYRVYSYISCISR